MINPIISLALSMQSNPGVYALLLGSGISRSAGMPTGWEVVLDLIRKLATLEHEDPEPDPEAWYTTKYGHSPTYSGLLELVVKSQAERSNMLRAYFEPASEVPEQGQKIPTKAHKAIARLAKRGSVRVILTTNFDRLMEQALEAEGVNPTTVSSPDDVDGAMPLVHSDCTLIKVHGDYLDLRTQNIPTELDKYDARIDELLDRIFDEFGLIVCGWSAEWDVALQRAIKRAKGRRFTTYWTTIGKLDKAAEHLVKHRSAQIIETKGADDFFADLDEKVSALENMATPHPLSAKMAVAQTKKYLANPKCHIQLHDLLMDEVDRIIHRIDGEHYPVQGTFDNSNIAQRIADFETITAVAASIMATGGFWGKSEHHKLWVRALERLANRDRIGNGITGMLALQSYPTVLLQYAVGIGAAASGNLDTLYAILTLPKAREGRGNEYFSAGLDRELDQDVFKVVEGLERRLLARNEQIHAALRETFRILIPSDTDYDEAFDTFETLQCVESVERIGWAMPGVFMYRYYLWHGTSRFAQRDGLPLLAMDEDIKRRGEEARVLRAGFLHKSRERWLKAMVEIDKMSQRYA